MEIRYTIVLNALVVKQDIPRLDTIWRQEVRDVMRAKLSTNPDIYGKPLRQTLRGYRTLRVGDYRIVFRIEKARINVIAIIHRSEVYKEVGKRIK
jgi:mRNA interferase RelE/StbE